MSTPQPMTPPHEASTDGLLSLLGICKSRSSDTHVATIIVCLQSRIREHWLQYTYIENHKKEKVVEVQKCSLTVKFWHASKPDGACHDLQQSVDATILTSRTRKIKLIYTSLVYYHALIRCVAPTPMPSSHLPKAHRGMTVAPESDVPDGCLIIIHARIAARGRESITSP